MSFPQERGRCGINPLQQGSSDNNNYPEALEVRLLGPEVRRSPGQVSALLDDSFTEIESSGRTYERADGWKMVFHQGTRTG